MDNRVLVDHRVLVGLHLHWNGASCRPLFVESAADLRITNKNDVGPNTCQDMSQNILRNNDDDDDDDDGHDDGGDEDDLIIR